MANKNWLPQGDQYTQEWLTALEKSEGVTAEKMASDMSFEDAFSLMTAEEFKANSLVRISKALGVSLGKAILTYIGLIRRFGGSITTDVPLSVPLGLTGIPRINTKFSLRSLVYDYNWQASFFIDYQLITREDEDGVSYITIGEEDLKIEFWSPPWSDKTNEEEWRDALAIALALGENRLRDLPGTARVEKGGVVFSTDPGVSNMSNSSGDEPKKNRVDPNWLPAGYNQEWLAHMEKKFGMTAIEMTKLWKQEEAKSITSRSFIEGVRYNRLRYNLGIIEAALLYIGLMRRFGSQQPNTGLDDRDFLNGIPYSA